MSFNTHDYRNKRRSTVMNAAEMLANGVALIATFFITPQVYARTIGFVTRFTETSYGAEFVDPVQLLWMPAVGFLTFYIARISIETAIMSAALAFAVRFV